MHTQVPLVEISPFGTLLMTSSSSLLFQLKHPFSRKPSLPSGSRSSALLFPYLHTFLCSPCWLQTHTFMIQFFHLSLISLRWQRREDRVSSVHRGFPAPNTVPSMCCGHLINISCLLCRRRWGLPCPPHHVDRRTKRANRHPKTLQNMNGLEVSISSRPYEHVLYG